MFLAFVAVKANISISNPDPYATPSDNSISKISFNFIKNIFAKRS